MSKQSFIIYHSDLKGLDFLTDAQAGKLFKAVAKNRLQGVEASLGSNPAVNILFNQIIEHIEINEAKYEATCKKKSESMKKRWEESRNTIEHYSKPPSSIKEGLALGDNDNDNDNENENENENDNDNDNDNVYDNDNVPAQENTQKENYGIYKNVTLTKEEYAALNEKLGDKTNSVIDSMSQYMKAGGKTYADCYARLLTWKLYDDTTPTSKAKKSEPSYDIDAFTRRAIGLKFEKREKCT